MTTAWFGGVQRWTPAEIEADAAIARADFRTRRLGETLARYLAAFDAAHPRLRQLVGEIDRVLAGGPAATQLLRELWGSDAGRTAFRYLGAPPISEDDLKTLAEARLSASLSDEASDKLLAIMRVIVDPRRFPWLFEERPPSAAEVHAAAMASASLIASQRVQTLRRSDEKAAVEGAVKGLLVGMGWRLAPLRSARGIQMLLSDSPEARTFATQTKLGSDNADVIVRLDDGRLLAIECKGSNSEINSRKRLNKEAAQNARAWNARFGSDQIVPAAALQGVFKARYVAAAQDTPMAIFWSHRLDDLREFVSGAN